MGKLSNGPLEARLAVTFFLLLLGAANFFGAWEVKNFSSFTPDGVAATVAPEVHHAVGMRCEMCSMSRETPIDPDSLDRPKHTIGRDLLVQDTHVHIPVYSLTAGALSLVIFGLALSSATRSWLVTLAFAAPALDFLGLWGAHLAPSLGGFFGTVTVGGGSAMALAYLIVLWLTLSQCWFQRSRKELYHA
ncbi:MAG TPA: hypothetical protein VIE43_07540 [Thermoanaerobaculia bacterium]|jgi:hypothetical protein|nr:hypothetical protein [Thermoanaerobaculia bacterium]